MKMNRNIEYKRQIVSHSLSLLQKIAEGLDEPIISRFSDCGHTPSGSFDFGNTCARGSNGDDGKDEPLHGVDEEDDIEDKEPEEESDEEGKWLEDTIKNFEKLPNKKKAKESLKQAMTLLQAIVYSFMDDEPEEKPTNKQPKKEKEVAASPQKSVQGKETGESKSKSEHKSESKSNDINSIAESASKHMDRQKAMAEIDKLADTNPKELVNMANEFLGSKVAKSKKDAINKIKDAVSIQIRDAMRARDIKNQ
jgi:hypothetical protein